jgi:hypothetical protein
MLTAPQRRAISAFGRPMLAQEHWRMNAWGLAGPDDVERFLEGRTTHFAVHPPNRHLQTPWHLGLLWHRVLRPAPDVSAPMSIEDAAEVLAANVNSVELVKELCSKGRRFTFASAAERASDAKLVAATVRQLAATHPPAPIVDQLLQCLEDTSRFSEATTLAALLTFVPDAADHTGDEFARARALLQAPSRQGPSAG